MKSNADDVAKQLSDIGKRIEIIKNGKTKVKSSEDKEIEINKLLKRKQVIVENATKKIESKLNKGK